MAAYLRVSSDEQREQKTIELQRVEIRQFCEAYKLQVEFYEDDGVSGEILFGNRPSGARLLKDLADRQVDRVLVWRLDRLGREMFVLITALAEIERYAKIESTTEGTFSLKDPTKILMTAVTCGMASADKAGFLFKTKTASRNWAAKSEGMWMGGVAPYGYRQVGEDKQARLAPSEEPISPSCKLSEVDVIRLIFQKAAHGESCWEIAKHLNNDLGVPPAYADPRRDLRRGGKNREEKKRRATKGIWWSTRVRSVIANRTYMGEHVWGKQQVVRGNDASRRKHLRSAPCEQWITRRCPAIVTEDLWNQANAMLHQNRTACMGHPKHKYLLRGLIRCQCGRTYIGVTAKQRNGTERAYYRCASKYTDRSIRDTCPRCSSPGLRGEALEAPVWDYVAGFLARPGMAIRQLKSQMAAEGDPGRRVREEIRRLENALQGKDKARGRVLAQVGEGLFRDGEIKKELQRIDEAAAGIKKHLAELRKISTEREGRVLSLDWAGRLLGDLRAKVQAGELTFEKKRKFVETLVAGITVKTPGSQKQPEIEVTFRFDSDYERARKWGRSGLVPAYTGSHPS
jgi:site-specific DNA recombinase